MTNSIDILILADRGAQSLRPLAEFTPPPLLPVGGKPLIEHMLEAISTEVDARVTVVVAVGDTRTPQWLADHGFPRLSIEITDQPVSVLDRDMVVLRGDIAPEPELIKRILKSADEPARFPQAGAWRMQAGEMTPTWRHTAMLANNADSLLPTRQAYWRTSLAAARGEIKGLRLAGWTGDDGMRVGMDARVLTRRAAGQNILIGASAFIDKHVQLGDNVVIGDGCFIAKGAVLSDTVIMPGSYVGPGLTLSHALVCGSWLCRVDSDEMVLVEDATILGQLAA